MPTPSENDIATHAAGFIAMLDGAFRGNGSPKERLPRPPTLLEGAARSQRRAA